MKTRGEIPSAIRACVAAMREVEGELRGERDEQNEHGAASAGAAHAGGGEDEHRAERVGRPRRAGRARARAWILPLDELEDVAEHHARGNAQRHELEREAGTASGRRRVASRRRETRADLELDVVGERVGADERQHQQRRGRRRRSRRGAAAARRREEDAARRPRSPRAPRLPSRADAARPRLSSSQAPRWPGSRLGRAAHEAGIGSGRNRAFTRTRDSEI